MATVENLVRGKIMKVGKGDFCCCFILAGNDRKDFGGKEDRNRFSWCFEGWLEYV